MLRTDLSYNVIVHENKIQFIFRGEQDYLRIIVRRALFSLKLLDGVEHQIDHLSEIQKMSTADKLATNHACISVTLELNAFSHIVKLYRYCLEQNLPVTLDSYSANDHSDSDQIIEYQRDGHTHHANLSGYLSQIIREARLAPAMRGTVYQLPVSRLYWTRDELSWQARYDYAKHHSCKLFDNSQIELSDEIELKRNRLTHIISLVEAMLHSHPENHSMVSCRDRARAYLQNYYRLAKENPGNAIFSTHADFPLIRLDDQKKFAELAMKYGRYEVAYHELLKQQHKQEQNYQCKIL